MDDDTSKMGQETEATLDTEPINCDQGSQVSGSEQMPSSQKDFCIKRFLMGSSSSFGAETVTATVRLIHKLQSIDESHSFTRKDSALNSVTVASPTSKKKFNFEIDEFESKNSDDRSETSESIALERLAGSSMHHSHLKLHLQRRLTLKNELTRKNIIECIEVAKASHKVAMALAPVNSLEKGETLSEKNEEKDDDSKTVGSINYTIEDSVFNEDPAPLNDDFKQMPMSRKNTHIDGKEQSQKANSRHSPNRRRHSATDQVSLNFAPKHLFDIKKKLEIQPVAEESSEEESDSDSFS